MQDYRYTRVEKLRILKQPFQFLHLLTLATFNLVLLGWIVAVLVLVEHMAVPPAVLIEISPAIIAHSPHVTILIGALCVGDVALMIVAMILPGKTVIKTSGPSDRQ